MIQVLIQKLDASLPLPFYATQGSSGIDLYSAQEAILSPSSHLLMPTGIKMQIPEGYEGQVRPRSGLALNHQITVLNSPGTIDASYRGEIKVILMNFSQKEFKIEKGMRIAQLVICPIVEACLVLTESLDEDTSRGSGGFGSTGL